MAGDSTARLQIRVPGGNLITPVANNDDSNETDDRRVSNRDISLDTTVESGSASLRSMIRAESLAWPRRILINLL